MAAKTAAKKKATKKTTKPKARAKRTKSASKIRCAAIGLGMGRHHADGFAADPRSELVAICDLNTDLCNARIDEKGWHGTRVYTDFKEMLKVEKPDVVSVALPNFLHAPVSIAALKAGAHVLCEKPMAMTVAECRKMISAANKAKRKLMINFSYRYTAASQYMKRLVEDGELGNIYYARTGWHRRRGIPGLGGWFTNKKLAGGGPLIDLGVHRIDLAWWLMGCPKPLTVSGSTYAKFGPKLAKAKGGVYTVEDLAAGMVRFEGGATLLLEVSWACNTAERERMFTELYGDKGGARQINLEEGYKFKTELYTEIGGAQVDVAQHMDAATHGEGGVPHLLSCVEGDLTPASPGEHGLAIQQILEGIYKSAKLGKEIKVG